MLLAGLVLLLGPGRDFACLASDETGTRAVQSPSALEIEFVLAQNADWKVFTSVDRTRFGRAVASAGNVDSHFGDDVLVGAPYEQNPETGAKEGYVYLYLTTFGGLNTTKAWKKSGGMKASLFGWSVAGVGDVDGDELDDAIIGAPGYMTDEDKKVGRAFVYSGDPGLGLKIEHTWSYTGTVQDSEFGYVVAGAGDVNKDGIDDIVVGAPGYTDQEGVQDGEGAIFVFYGRPDLGPSTEPDWIIDSDQARAHLGQAVSAAGDVNGDGYGDLIVGAPTYLHYDPEDPATAVREGAALLFLGGDTQPTDYAWIAYGGQEYSGFGSAVAGAGDVNGDGFPDIVVGAPKYDKMSFGPVGAAFAFCGNKDLTLDSDPCWSALGDQYFEEYGYGTSVGRAGDVNTDGYDDVIVGAPNYPSDPDSGLEGAAFVYFGSGKGLSPWAGWKAGGDRARTDFGFSVGSAGYVTDPNQDGIFDDVESILVGAPQYYQSGVPYGGAFAFYGPLQPADLNRTYLPLVLRNWD